MLWFDNLEARKVLPEICVDMLDAFDSLSDKVSDLLFEDYHDSEEDFLNSYSKISSIVEEIYLYGENFHTLLEKAIEYIDKNLSYDAYIIWERFFIMTSGSRGQKLKEALENKDYKLFCEEAEYIQWTCQYGKGFIEGLMAMYIAINGE